MSAVVATKPAAATAAAPAAAAAAPAAADAEVHSSPSLYVGNLKEDVTEVRTAWHERMH